MVVVNMVSSKGVSSLIMVPLTAYPTSLAIRQYNIM